MESSFLIEVDNTSTIRTGALHCYHYTLTPLPASRLLVPRSGLERSDFVLWPAPSSSREMSATPPLSGMSRPAATASCVEDHKVRQVDSAFTTGTDNCLCLESEVRL